jgi:hypothetical protein
MRSAINRASKYSAKLVGDVVKNRIDAQRDSMIEQESVQFTNLANYETQIKEVCDADGTAHSIDMPFYYAFGRQCYKLMNTHGTGAMADEEAQGRANMWVTRGLTESILVSIANLFGLTVTTA